MNAAGAGRGFTWVGFKELAHAMLQHGSQALLACVLLCLFALQSSSNYRKLVSASWASRAHPGCPAATIMCMLDSGAGEGVLLLIVLAMALSGAMSWWEHASEQVDQQTTASSSERLLTAALNASAVPAPPRVFVSHGWRGIRGL